MSLLTIHPENRPDDAEVIREPEAIAQKLWEIGVLFERWAADGELSPDADQESVIEAYRESIDRLIDRYEFRSVDVVRIQPDNPKKAELRAMFLNEHTHDDFEVRFFVEGKGLFYLHPNDKVYVLLCEQGDLISIPAHIKHWFDMGENPHLTAIRLFTTPDGWIARFTDSGIAGTFPSFEQFLTRYV